MLLAFLLSASLCSLIVFTKKFHARFTLDNDNGPQKIHLNRVPRVGGVAIISSLFTIEFLEFEARGFALGTLIICALPVFIAGLAEDLTKVFPLMFD